MRKENPFPYYVGIHSLKEIATPESKVCVMNILGNESKGVTPVSHAYSGGNVVAGVQYGRRGRLETKVGDIPVYPRLAEAVKEHDFDTGVIYLPPDAVFHAVTELCHYNQNLKKIVILTEKINVKDQRLIRAVAQTNKIDVFGANCLGVADSWNHVRIGGALGGDRPEEALVKGSIAIHSNSGNFSTTIAEYLKTAGFGTSTIVSSGKDVIIHYAVAEFLYAAQNDPRTKAVVLYVEPGGYYEAEALRMIKEGRFEFTKPIVVSVTGRWKSNLTRACGHAGALAGQGDDAIAKEKWFDGYFGVPEFDPDNPENVSELGVRVASIQQIPQAMSAIFKKLGWEADFEPRGDLGLKPWLGNDFGLNLPLHLRLKPEKPIAPYDAEIEAINKQLGATYLRQNMRNASGASRIDPATQVAELHGMPVVELTDYPFESNMLFALIKMHPKKECLPFANLVLNYLARPEDIYFDIVKQARENGATPNQALIAVAGMLGESADMKLSQTYAAAMVEMLSELGLRDIYTPFDTELAVKILDEKLEHGNSTNEKLFDIFRSELKKCHSAGELINFFADYITERQLEDNTVFLITAILVNFAFSSLVLKKIPKEAVINLYTYLSIEAKLTVLNSVDFDHNTFIQKLIHRQDDALLLTSFTETAYYAVFNEKPKGTRLREFSALLALTLTNGPGTISAKGAKESVSARNNISTAFAGFLSNTGLSHGGSGYEAVEFLL